jgi:hypothetical protein
MCITLYCTNTCCVKVVAQRDRPDRGDDDALRSKVNGWASSAARLVGMMS